MIKFNPENKESLTFGECLEPAMEIKAQEEATQYKIDYIKFTEKFLKNGVSEPGLTAEEIVNINLGYFAGYYSDETRRRVEKLFLCSHPIFGSIKDNGAPTNEEALECGKSKKTLKEIRA